MPTSGTQLTRTIVRMAAQDLGVVSDALYRLASQFSNYYRNYNFDMRTNGERWLVHRLCTLPLRTVFDVGANVGDWSKLWLEKRGISLHAFEPIVTTAAQFHVKLSGDSHLILNAVGLSDTTGDVSFSYQDGECLTPSMTLSNETQKEIYGAEYSTLTARVIRGDAYCHKRAIEHIDVMKIDVEGAEHTVLQGFGSYLTNGSIGLIQFECGIQAVATKWLLADFHKLLERCGYRVGRLMPRRVDFQPYSPWHEDFRGPNYVAVHCGREDILNVLR